MIKISLPTAIPMSLLVLWCLGFAIDAEAGLKICNRSSHVIWLALAEGKDAQPRAHGWYGLDVGTCQTFYGAKLNNRYYYGYAFDAAGNVWEGDFQFCLHPQVSFTIHGDDHCRDRLLGAKRRGFFEIDVRDALQFTHELSSAESTEAITSPANVSTADDMSLAAAWARQDYEAVLAQVRPAAQAGEAWALNVLGLMHLYGHGVPQSYRDGAKWIQQAETQGWDKAQYNLARSLYEAPGVEVDIEQVVFWLRRAASQEIVAAQQSLHAIQQTLRVCGTPKATSQLASRSPQPLCPK